MFIKEVRRIYKNNGSFRKTAEICNINRRTVKKYIDMKNIKRDSVYFRESSSYYDRYNEYIVEKLDQGLSVKMIFDFIKEQDPKIKYGALSHYIRNINKGKHTMKNSYEKEIVAKITITRNQIKKYIFNWKLDAKIAKHIEQYFIPSNPSIVALKNFYRIFQTILKNHNVGALKKLLSLESVYPVIQRFIRSLRKEYISIINTAKYEYNNSQVEGQVGKLKRIKNRMYGRGNITLLKNKVIFQSLFF